MRRKSKYDLSAQWDDPFERQGERRKNERCTERFKLKIGLRVPEHENLLAGAAVVENISQTGLLCRTKHQLKEGQEVHLAIPTSDFSTNNDFPKKFVGRGRVSRLTNIDGNVSEVGIVFATDLSEDMSFSIFIESLQSIAMFKSTLK